jgi:hypothetical protein
MVARRTRRGLRGTPAQHRAAAESFYAKGNAVLTRIERLAPKKSCAWRSGEVVTATLLLGASIAEAREAKVPKKIIARVASPFTRRMARLLKPCLVKKAKG